MGCDMVYLVNFWNSEHRKYCDRRFHTLEEARTACIHHHYSQPEDGFSEREWTIWQSTPYAVVTQPIPSDTFLPSMTPVYEKTETFYTKKKITVEEAPCQTTT